MIKDAPDADDHMTCATVASADRLRRVRLASIRVTLWKQSADRLDWVLTFAGDVDAPKLEAVLQQVERVTTFVCGSWHLEFLAAGLAPDDERTVTRVLCALLRLDVRHRLILLPRRASAVSPSRMLH